MADTSGRAREKFNTAPVIAPPLDHSHVKSEDIELWAIRCPPGFDASQLEGLDMAADRVTQGEGFEVRPAPSDESDAVLSAFPSAKKGRWLLGKPFSRQLVVSLPEAPKKAAAAAPPPPLPPVPKIPGLRLRHIFLGGTMPAAVAAAPSSRKRTAASEEADAAKAAKKAKKEAKKAAKTAAR